ncbi:MAG: M23 family metallopeptidase, partial [Deltaproteobacteria bacterium]|nr:M23 family metallopeptidase [Deltaproteobacteria bacterium]
TPEKLDAATPTKEAPHKVREENLGPTRAEKPSPSTITPGKETPEPRRKVYRPRFIWPAEGTVSSKFGTYKGMRHNGIKIDGKEGTPILAAAGGTVTYSAPMKYFGETIIIKHSDIYSTVYSHLKERMVNAGATVGQGDRIGLMGKEETGKARLSFEIRRKNRAKNPLRYLPKKK